MQLAATWPVFRAQDIAKFCFSYLKNWQIAPISRERKDAPAANIAHFRTKIYLFHQNALVSANADTQILLFHGHALISDIAQKFIMTQPPEIDFSENRNKTNPSVQNR